MELNINNKVINIVSKEPISLNQKKAYNLFLKNAKQFISIETNQTNYFKIPISLLYVHLTNNDTDDYKDELKKLMYIVAEISDKENPKYEDSFNLITCIKKDEEYCYYELSNSILQALKGESFFNPLDLLVINSDEKLETERNIKAFVNFIMADKGKSYKNNNRNNILYCLQQGFLEDGKYKSKSEDEIPEEIIDKNIRISLMQDLMG